ncbi:MAG: hypothetical protein JRF54_08955, partial [Deltaproteobacteria bacterium]|nr:hypothetical protein [Deltaproteobacteria bacterium]
EEAEVGDWHGWLSELAIAGRATHFVTEYSTLWTAAERLPLLEASWPDGRAETNIEVPARHRSETWTAEDAAREIVRGRLQASGPATAQRLGQVLGLGMGLVDAALGAKSNGANGGSWRGFTATPSTVFARKSKRSARRTTCASC